MIVDYLLSQVVVTVKRDNSEQIPLSARYLVTGNNARIRTPEQKFWKTLYKILKKFDESQNKNGQRKLGLCFFRDVTNLGPENDKKGAKFN